MKRNFPHPIMIMLLFIAAAAVMTWLVPAGQYDRVPDEATGRDVVVQGSYHTIENQPVAFFDMLVAIPKGIVSSADVIAFILILGGCFYVIEKTGAFNEALGWLVTKFKNAEMALMVFVGVVFCVGGVLNGLAEEVIAMMPIVLLLTAKTDYTKEAAVAISFGSANIGGSFGPSNPFVVLIAQKVAGVEPFSDSLFRIVFTVIALAVWIFFVLMYGKSKAGSTMNPASPSPGLSLRSVAILSLLLVTFGVMIYGAVTLEWDFLQMAAPFFALGITAGVIGKLGFNGTGEAYTDGFRDMVFACVVVGFARAIFLIMQEGLIVDTIVHALFSPLDGLPQMITAVGMMISHVIIHIPVPSTSGQAMLTMPLLAPIADLTGMSRQIVVLAYQYGASLTDLITPTNGTLMAVIAAAGVAYDDWFRFIWKALLTIFAVAAVALITALLFNI
ncbi:YfcC family protein [uncultured Imperialibacter sp.]|uniref:YfcC family protein n=1 Tax=uncultured Imperialibacter sp. TaxID=1672639 RepID=UPI0030DB8D73|tara:strand:- start:2779 stop:4113 length:1335 start_codon:yes stop_codon:yes gene_type:complete